MYATITDWTPLLELYSTPAVPQSTRRLISNSTYDRELGSRWPLFFYFLHRKFSQQIVLLALCPMMVDNVANVRRAIYNMKSASSTPGLFCHEAGV